MTVDRRSGTFPLAALRRHTANELDKARARFAVVQRLQSADRAERDRLNVELQSAAATFTGASTQALDPGVTSRRIEFLVGIHRRIEHVSDRASRRLHQLELARSELSKIHERLVVLDRYRDNHLRCRLAQRAAREMQAADSEWLARLARARRGHEGGDLRAAKDDR